MLSKIDRCNICGGKVEVQYKLKNKDLIGMAEDYTQEVAIVDSFLLETDLL